MLLFPDEFFPFCDCCLGGLRFGVFVDEFPEGIYCLGLHAGLDVIFRQAKA